VPTTRDDRSQDDDPQQHDNQNGNQVDVQVAEIELLVSGPIYPNHVPDSAIEVHRGMAMMTIEGHEAGRVAAVVIAKEGQQVTHLLLSRLAYTPEYRLVPVHLIQEVREERVLLRIFNHVVSNLPAWHGVEPHSPNQQ
jgi:sporulation protein YlmC with PRC-barrel domain